MFIADFHVHSKYSRATSKECIPEYLDLWARKKGLHLIGTGDFTHPAWRGEMREKLIPAEDGLYKLKADLQIPEYTAADESKPRFIVSGEISCIYKKHGKVRKVHNLILLPSLDAAEALSRRLEAVGNLHSDGRPILGLDSRDLMEITLDVCADALFIPAHIWTPHFSLFGAYSGFDEIEACFEDLTGHIFALETGLSSDPPMNWRLSVLDRFTLISNSDAHSPANLAREANLFDTELSYRHVASALQNRETEAFLGTIEFFPEEGKYHYDGHRRCKVCLAPVDTKAAAGLCPVCGGKITIGVLNRVEALADRPEGFIPSKARRFERLVPLREVIASSIGMTEASVKVKTKYAQLLDELGPELCILRQIPLEDIERKAGVLIAEGIRRLRAGEVKIEPGYDGEYGKIRLFEPNEISVLSGQVSLFSTRANYGDIGAEPGIPKEPLCSLLNAPHSKFQYAALLGASRGEAGGGGYGLRRPGAPPLDPAKGLCPLESPAAHARLSSNANAAKNGMTRAVESAPEGLPYGLNAGQWAAVSASDAAVSVVAGPGTGKTKTLVGRIAYLVEHCGIPPSEITAVTFTNKAAKEMRTRLEGQFGGARAVKDMTIGTFHAICLGILSKEEKKDNITVIGEPDALSIVADILKTLSVQSSPRDALRYISLRKNRMPDEKTLPAQEEIYRLYCAHLEEYGVLDYDDVLIKTLKLFESGCAPIPAFAHLLVDEFQDINPVQYELIKVWSRHSADVFVIGDPNQAIYGFRGSDSRCFERFFADFPYARKIGLTQNYRSTPEILYTAQSLIFGPNASGHIPPLTANRESGAKVRLIEVDNALSEAACVAREINRMVGGMDMLNAHGTSGPKGKKHADGPVRALSDIAVLYRTNRQSQALEQCFLREGIPYTVTGREEFHTEPQVRRATAFFRFLLNPSDILSLRIYLKESELPPAVSQEIIKSYRTSGKSVGALCAVLDELHARQASGEVRRLLESVEKNAPLVRSEKPSKLIEGWIADNGLAAAVCMELLCNTAVLHETMASFLQNFSLGREGDIARSGAMRYSLDAVSLMTLHGSKGLEFPAVFLCGIKDGMVPFRGRDGESNPEEERRLFYVGMTRAKDELILLTSDEPSPFVADLSSDSIIREDAIERKEPPSFSQLSFLGG